MVKNLSRPVRHSKDCNTVWQIEWIFLIYLSFVAVCLTVVGNIKSVILHSLGLSNSVLYNKIRLRCLGHTLKGKKSTNTYLFRAMASLDRPNTATILKLQLVCHRNDYCTVWIDSFFLIYFITCGCVWLTDLQEISKQIFWHFHLDF